MIKFLVDQNISPKIVTLLKSLGFEAKRVTDVGLSGADDEEIAGFAIENDYVIVTLDLDFGQLYYFVFKNLSVVIARPKIATTEAVGKLLENFLRAANANELKNSLIILKEGHYRLIRH